MADSIVATVRRRPWKRLLAQGADRGARLGLVGRAAFYLLLAGIVAAVAATGHGVGKQPDANGVLSLVASSVPGEVAISLVVVGFAAFGVERLVAAWRDHHGPLWKRVTTGLQGAFYLALAYVPASFLFGRRQAGSQQAQSHTTARLLGMPGGRVVVVLLGVVVVGICAWQVRTALTDDFEDGLRLNRAPRWVRRLVDLAGTTGIASRAMVFLPIGVFLIVSGVQDLPGQSKGLDVEALQLARHAWGRAVLALMAVGLLVFAVYTMLEARYRDVRSDR